MAAIRSTTRKSLAGVIGGLLLTGLSPAASSQAPSDAQDDPDNSIVVTGTKISPGEARRQASDFVRKIGVVDGDKPVARWAEGICPYVGGLDDHYAAIVAEQVRAIARAAKVPIAGFGCITNIVIKFSPDAAAEVRSISARAPGALEQVPMAARTALREGGIADPLVVCDQRALQ